ncbi:sterol desaturase family protein [Aestuariivita boseongensis]|uniref:sterol desaturase family protein n=1 Tax=Aestuariivita boseongensis TaxID=1470562 RepID=UPI00067FA932|nr:sterol desaturase family protein [Aestuariivita boseongensis]
MEQYANTLSEFLSVVAGPTSRLWPVYLLVTLGLCMIIYRQQAVRTSFVKWLFPKSIYFHASHIVDLKVFVLNRIFTAIGMFNVVVFSPIVALAIVNMFGAGGTEDPLHPVLIAILLLMAGDFATYWVHRVHHESRIIWPFHSLHHSAEVMTPITVYRKHPIYDLISSFVRGVLIGGLQGVMLCVFDQAPTAATIAGVNACYILFNIAGSNLRHSHVWLSFGPVIEHIFISPAQHQIHHSLDPRHHNKNYGEVLAIWDWMFGTLYVPRQRETVEFGLGDRHGNRIAQPHDSLSAAMVVPVRDSLRQIAKLLGMRRYRMSAGEGAAATATPETPSTPAE